MSLCSAHIDVDLTTFCALLQEDVLTRLESDLVDPGQEPFKLDHVATFVSTTMLGSERASKCCSRRAEQVSTLELGSRLRR